MHYVGLFVNLKEFLLLNMHIIHQFATDTHIICLRPTKLILLSSFNHFSSMALYLDTHNIIFSLDLVFAFVFSLLLQKTLYFLHIYLPRHPCVCVLYLVCCAINDYHSLLCGMRWHRKERSVNNDD